MLVPADPLAGAEGLGDLWLVAEHRSDDVEGARHEGRPALIGKDHRLLGRERVAPARRIVRGIAGSRLRREPFPGITLGDAGAPRQRLGR